MKKNAWNIRRLVYKSFVPSTQRTSMTYCRLSDFRYEMMVRGLFGHCAFMASRSDLIAGPQGWFLRFCSLACAAKRVNSPYFVQKLIDIKKSGQIAWNLQCIPTKLSLGVSSPSVDYRKSDRKVNQITMKYNLMLLRCGLPFYTISWWF